MARLCCVLEGRVAAPTAGRQGEAAWGEGDAADEVEERDVAAGGWAD